MGYIVSVPEIVCRYDFLLDIGTSILRIQAKTCRESSDGSCIIFNTSNVTHNSNGYKNRKYTADQVDYFCTYYKEKCYLIPFSECPSKEKKLRLVPPKNSQVKNIYFAKDYVAELIINSLK